MDKKILRQYIKEILSEWELANDKNLMLDQEGMEKSDRENVSRYLKSLGLLESTTISVVPGDEYLFPVVPYPQIDSPEGIKDLNGVIIQYQDRKVPESLQHFADRNMVKLFESYLGEKGLTFNTQYYSKLKKGLVPLILELKNFYARPRPSETAAFLGINFTGDVLETAQSPSYPSGHTIQAYVIAELLCEQFPEYASDLLGIAEIISQSRIDRGVHFPSDVEFGKEIAAVIVDEMKDGSL